MRTVSDENGTEWTVFEVKRQTGSTERWTYLPEEYGDGWLCFESSLGKRRLTPVPARWREFSDGELRGLVSRAQPVNRGRPAEDSRDAQL